MMASHDQTKSMMKAAVYQKPHHTTIETRPYPQPGPGEVTIAVRMCGICGTDYHMVEGDFISPYPIVGGHEFSGIVAALGSGVDHVQVGDRVAADPSLFCGFCEQCRKRRFNHCHNWNAVGVTTDGAFAEYVRVPAANVFVLPNSISFEQGALIEPLSCVAYALERLDIQFGDRAVIFGAGPMGLLLLQALSTSGISEVIVVDVDEAKLTLAEQLGATATYMNDDHLSQKIGAARYRTGWDIVVDATGIPRVIEAMFAYAGPRAQLLQFGVAPTDARITINPFEVYHKDWKYLGSMALMYHFQHALQMMEQHRVDVDKLISTVLSLEEFATYMHSPKAADVCKVLVRPTKGV